MRKFFGFNPCFNGSVERGQRYGIQSYKGHSVSILVLMEVLREADQNFRDQRRIIEQFAVSILVLMEVLREATVQYPTDPPTVVSILVLMEVLREDCTECREISPDRAFQSLF